MLLVVDLDPQGNLEDDLGYADDDRNDQGESLAKALMFGGTVDALIGVREHLDVWAGGGHLAKRHRGAQRQDGQRPDCRQAGARTHPGAGGRRLRLHLPRLPPGDGVLHLAALLAARWVLVASKTDNSSIKGVAKVAERIDQVLDVNRGIDLLGVILTDVGTATGRKDGTVVIRDAERDARTELDAMFGVGDEGRHRPLAGNAYRAAS